MLFFLVFCCPFLVLLVLVGFASPNRQHKPPTTLVRVSISSVFSYILSSFFPFSFPIVGIIFRLQFPVFLFLSLPTVWELELGINGPFNLASIITVRSPETGTTLTGTLQPTSALRPSSTATAAHSTPARQHTGRRTRAARVKSNATHEHLRLSPPSLTHRPPGNPAG